MKIASLMTIALGLSILVAEASKYDNAVELYKEGPTKGPEIIQLLREHLADEPKDEKALKLLGITQFGIGNSKDALATIDRAIDLIAEDGRISAKMTMLKARALFDLDRKAECKKILSAYWAFWQDDENLKKLYEWYWERVKDEADATPPRGEQDGADQTATALDSKSEGEEKADIETEARSQ